MRGLSLLGAAVALALSIGAAVADDWVASKLRGKVLQLIDGEWQPLTRGAVVPDDRVIRTLNGGRVTFVRGNEIVDLGGNTQVQIHDREGKRPFTTVLQHFGKVEVEAEVRQVQHFAVQTPYLVAVVKGTRFVVVSGEDASEVRVRRGAVAVENNSDGSNAVVVAGQTAEAASGEALQVAGSGELPVVRDAKGNPVDAASSERGNSGNGNGNSANAKSGNGNSGNGNGNSASAKSGNSGNGNGNSGNGNSGNGNSGNGNSASGNSGNGNGNSGNGNSASGNSGNSSSSNGNGNSGNGNSGNGNSGNGNGNSGNGNSGNGNGNGRND